MTAGGDGRAERLAAQLRANLKRRKEQARAAAEPTDDGGKKRDPGSSPG